METNKEALAAAADPFYLVENEKLWIKTKTKQLVPLKLNYVQKKVLKVIKKLIIECRPIRLIILKSRQQGISTLIEAIVYAFTSQLYNVNSLILADDLDGSNYLYEMCRLYHEKLIPDLQYELKLSNQKKLEFANRQSQVRVDTADNLEAGRKYTFQYVHTSEVAFFRHALELMLGINQAVPALPGTMVVMESTANGVGGYFYDEWKRALRGETDWYPIFIAWFENPDYSMTVPKGWKLNDRTLMARDDDERAIMKKHGLELEQMVWRRWKIVNDCHGSVEQFNQEHPASEDEAFLVSGNCRFNIGALKDIKNTTANEGVRGRLVQQQKHVIFDPDPKGNVRLWKRPAPGQYYVIGADVAEGIEIEGIDAQDKVKRDFSTAEVLNAVSLEQVGELRCRYEPDVFAEEVKRLAIFFRKALVGVERNNHGIAVLMELIKIYDNVFYEEMFEEKKQVRKARLGWLTTLKSKPMMIAEGDKCIRNSMAVIHSPELLSECMTFVRFADGTCSAKEGCFDDLVMAWLIGLQMIRFAAPLEKKVDDQKKKAVVKRQAAQKKRRGY